MRINAKLIYNNEVWEYLESVSGGLLISNGSRILLVKRHKVKEVKV